MTDTRELPEAFLKEMREILGEEYDAFLESFNEDWRPGLRVNTIKITPEEFMGLAPWRLYPVPWTGKGFYYEEPEGQDCKKPSRHPAYFAGLYYLQEPSAMTPGAMFPVSPGDRVLDLCAAPGGKSTELAAKLQGQGMLVSNDISFSRAKALLKNLELAGASNICVTSESPKRLAEVWPEFFDKILVDAPCSGEGMFRRDPAMVKDWAARGPEYYGPIQRQILLDAVELLKPEGLMLYSTCTFSRLENEDNIRFLLKERPDMELVRLDLEAAPGSVDGIGLTGCIRLFPHKVRGEGHFLALLRKRGGTGESHIKDGSPLSMVNKGGHKRGELPDDLKVFLDELSVEWDKERIMVRQEQAYYMPRFLSWNLPLRFLRTGLLLGRCRKNRFEPSQALAMALKEGQFSRSLRLSMEDERVLRYLKGETIGIEEREGPIKGWCLVTADGHPLGWAKGGGMSLKNKYYPGWRWQ